MKTYTVANKGQGWTDTPWNLEITVRMLYMDGPCHFEAGTSQPIVSHQELAFLFPVGSLCVGVAVSLGHHVDELPLRPAGLGPRLQGLHDLLLLPLLSVLLDQAPFGHPLGVVQNH